jgi:hypothetical protein
MKIIVQSYSTTGLRPHNEDTMDLINNLDESVNTNIPILYNGIFDGHGGGDISKILIDKDKIYIQKYFCSTTSKIAQSLGHRKTFNNLTVDLFSRIQEKLKNSYISSNTMGSTALIALIYPKNEKQNKFGLKVINLGDSRAIACNKYNIGTQLTLDHKPHLFCEKSRIDQMGGVIYESDGDDPRIGGMSVSRSFGDLDNKFICQVPDIYDYELSGEKFIILACDGVWDVLHTQVVSDFMLGKIEELYQLGKQIMEFKGRSEFNLAQKLADFAIEKGSQDNVSISILFFPENF